MNIFKDTWEISRLSLFLNLFFGLLIGLVDSIKIVLIFLILPYVGIQTPSSLKVVEEFFANLIMAVGAEVNVISLSAVILLVIIISSVISIYTSWIQASLSQKYSLSLRNKLIDSIANSYWGYIRKTKYSDFNSVLTVEASKAQSAFIKVLFSINNFLIAAAYFTVAIYFAPEATFIIAVSGASVFLVNIIITRNLLARSQQITIENLTLFAHTGEFLHNLKILKATNSTAPVVRNVKKVFYKIFLNERFRYLVPDITKIISENFSIVALLLAVCAVALFGKTGMQTNVLLSLTFFMRISGRFNQMLNYFQQAMIEVPAVELIKKILIETAISREAEVFEKVLSADLRNGIQLNNLLLKHDEITILENVSLRLNLGSLNVFMGPSGSGKTSLVDALLGLNPLAGGNITIGNKTYHDQHFLGLRDHSAYVTQDTTLFDVSIFENIRIFMPEASNDEVITAAKLAGAHLFISSLPLGYETKINNSGLNISGGQKQRVSLARALLKNPQILILDEATSALDPETEAEIMVTVRELAKSKIVIFISHKKQILREEDILYIFKERSVRISLLSAGDFQNDK